MFLTFRTATTSDSPLSRSLAFLSTFTVFCSSVASVVAVLAVFITAFFVLPNAAHAATTYEEIPFSEDYELINFLNCSPYPTCRNTQMYASRGQTLPVGTMFDRIRIFTGNSTTSPRLYLNLVLDTGSPRTSCTDGPCVADDTYLPAINPIQVLNKGGGVWEYVVPTRTVSGSGTYFYISFDPETPYQKYRIDLAFTGTIENGLNMNRNSGGYAYQLCSGTCDDVGKWSNVSVPTYSENFQTRFLSGIVSGLKTAVNFNITYFLKTSEYTVGNRPDYIYYNIIKDELLNDSQVYSSTQIILPLVTGTSSKTMVSAYAHSAGNYIANFTFWNIQNNGITFNLTTLTLKYTVDNSGVTTYSTLAVTNGTGLDTSIAYEDCAFYDLECGIKNGFRFLFIPSTEQITAISTTYDGLYSRVPFVYLKEIPIVLTELFPPNTSNFSIGAETGIGGVTFFDTSEFESLPYKDQLRDLMTAVLWVGFALLMYRKATKIHDTTT